MQALCSAVRDIVCAMLGFGLAVMGVCLIAFLISVIGVVLAGYLVVIGVVMLVAVAGDLVRRKWLTKSPQRSRSC